VFLYLLLAKCNSNSQKTSLPPSLPPPGAAGTNVTTYHNDNARSAQNLTETILTPSNVNSSSFAKIFVITVDGKVDASVYVETKTGWVCLACCSREPSVGRTLLSAAFAGTLGEKADKNVRSTHAD
jgi:hypothetical protein